MVFAPDVEHTAAATEGTPEEVATPDIAPSRPSRWWWFLAGLVVAAVLVGGGYWLGIRGGDDTEVGAVSSTLASTDEPVAAVAAAMLPSTVEIETDSGLGSGFIYDADGYILTAAHVVQGYQTVSVRLSDGTPLDGTVVGIDSGTDVAVVKVDQPGLTPAVLAVGTPLQVGQLAVAVGSPFGLDNAVTAGVVSAAGQPIESSSGAIKVMIQTDAAINPGNSGGPLANREGQVIGVNDSIFSRSGGNEGVGFAIPIDTAKQVADKLVAGEPITHAVLGVTGSDPTSGESGALIVRVAPGSAAATAGLEAGDLVTEADGEMIRSFVDLAVAIGGHQPGDQMVLNLTRNGQSMEITVVLGEAS